MRKSRKFGSENAQRIARLAGELLLRAKSREALRILRPALLRHPKNSQILTRYADALYLEKRISEARDAYEQALSLDEGIFQAWYGLGCAEYSGGAFASAITSFERAVAIDPADPETRCLWARSLFRMGQVDAAIAQFLVLAKHDKTEWRQTALGEIAKIIPGSPTRGNAEILRSRLAWAKLEAKAQGPSEKLRPRSHLSGQKPRIGYVCAFFGSRNWMKPVWGVINRHDRSAFEIHLFCDVEKPTSASGYFRHKSDSIHVISGLPNESAAKQIASAQIDILVDLNGYSYASRLGLFMRKPAPVLVGWFNMYATTGVRAFDYIIGDASVIPAREEQFYTERVLRVSGTYLAFRVLYPVPEVSPPPCIKSRLVTFGCFAPQYKITDEVIATWAQILAAAPKTRLRLKNTCLNESSNREAVWKRFGRFGVTQDRVLLEPPAEHNEFLRAYSRIDIALDTFPYNGGTTTMEALWQGVPVITFNGDRWASRTSRSLLRTAGLKEWDVQTRNAYVARAIELALSPETPRKLAALRRKMRQQILASPACDTQWLCRELEQHYRRIRPPRRALTLP
jgi:predicted O-linked N-acetylglucosamine transferase (SPINDLY family)